jgi:hypothetical protein
MTWNESDYQRPKGWCPKQNAEHSHNLEVFTMNSSCYWWHNSLYLTNRLYSSGIKPNAWTYTLS